MQDTFRCVGSAKPLWITLAVSGLCLATVCRGADACPSDALAPGVQISVAAYRQDGMTPVGTGYIGLGEPIILRSAIYYVPIDPVNGTALSAVEQGRLTISFNGVNHNVTPADGIPVVGCEGMAVVQSTNLAYMVSHADVLAGAITVRAEYIDGIALLSTPVPVHVIAHTHVKVRPVESTASATGPLSIQKTATGTTLLSFAGQPEKSYRIEATTDFVQWTALASVIPDSAGLCQTEDADAPTYSYRFYRYVVVN